MRATACAMALALLGCSDTEFTPRWRVERFRVLGVRVEPPDALPGEAVTLTAVTADRAGLERAPSIVWQLCARTAIDNSTGSRSCAGAVGGASMVGNPVRLAMPAAAEDGSPWAVFGLACGGGVPTLDAATMQPRCEGGEGEAFVRTVRVRRGEGNGNPRIARVLLDGVEMPAEGSARVAGCALTGDAREEGCARHRVTVEFAADAREAVRVVQPDGTARELPEALVTEFLADAGDLEGAFRSDNDAEGGSATHANGFRAPASGAVRLWVLVRDGRGGFDAVRRAMTVGP